MKLRNEIEKALDDNLSYGYEFQMSDYAVSKEQEKEYYKQGRKEVKKATSQILSLLEEAVGEEWHHNSATWCAGANTRRKDILNKINPRERTE